MAHRFQLASVVLLVCYVAMSNQNGTPRDLEKTFKGRCLNYPIKPAVNCDSLWRNFTSAWTYISPTGQRVPDYGQLFRNLAQKLPKDKLLLWSRTKEYAHKLSDKGKRYLTLEDTLVGSVVDGLTWCGQTSDPGINYDTCPLYGSSTAEPVKNFWLAASRWFVSQAAGEVRVVLNGSNPGTDAYSKESILGSVEVPGLQSNTVRKLTAIVVHDLGKPETETCASQSLLNLKAEILLKNIQFVCFEQQANRAVILGPADTLAQFAVITMAELLMINFIFIIFRQIN